MATSIITGRDLALTIDSATYDAQVTTVRLEDTRDRVKFQTVDGPAWKVIDDNWTMTVEMLADWGVASSLCEALWTKAETAPDTGIAYSLTANTGAVFTGNLYPDFPQVGGTAPDAQTVSFTFQCTATPTETFS